MFAVSMMAGGMSANLVRGLLGQVFVGLTSAGSTQADAYVLLRGTVQVFANVVGGSGARLPTGMEPGESLLIYNASAAQLLVYPPIGGVINRQTLNSALVVQPDEAAALCCVDLHTFFSFSGNSGGGGGPGIPGGSNTEVQFNDGGNFGGDAGLSYDKVADYLTVAGSWRLGPVDLLGDDGTKFGFFDPTGTSYGTVFQQTSVGTIEVNSGTKGDYRDLIVRNLNASGAIVAGTVNATNLGATNFSTTNLQAASIVQSGSTGNIAIGPLGTTLEVRSAGAGNAAYMTFHMPGAFGGLFGLDVDNVWKVGGWSMGQVAYPILHTGNSFNVAGNVLNAGSRDIGTLGNISGTKVDAKYFTLQYSGVLPVSGLVSADWNVAQQHAWTLGGPTIVDVINVPVGQTIKIVIQTGNFALSFGGATTIFWPMGVLPDFLAGPIKWCSISLQALSGPMTFLGEATIY
jgi:hypothetical protein